MPSIQDYMKQYQDQSVDPVPVSLPASQPIQIANAPLTAPTSQRGGLLRDVVAAGLKGVNQAVQGTVGLADLVSGGYAGKGIQALGYDSDAIDARLSGRQSVQQQQLDQQLAETKGFMPTVGVLASHPRELGMQVVQNLPAMFGGGLEAHAGLGLLAPKLLERISPALVGNVGEGLMQAGQMAEQVRSGNESGTITPGQTAESAASGVIDALIGRYSGTLANKLGIPDIQTFTGGGRVARTAAGELASKAEPGVFKRIGLTALNEGAQELAQGTQEQVWQNLATGRPLGEGVAENAAQSMVLGAAMGGPAGIFHSRLRAPGTVSNDDLKNAVDPAVAPPAAGTPQEPMQAEYEQAQREFQARMDQTQRQIQIANDRQAAEASVQPTMPGLGAQNDALMANAGRPALDLTGEAPQASPLQQLSVNDLQQIINRVEQGIVAGNPMPGAQGLLGTLRAELAQRPAEAAPDTRTTPMFGAEGTLSPEAAIAARADQARGQSQPMVADDVSARLQSAPTPAPNGQATLMAGQLVPPSPIQIAQGGTPVRLPDTTLRGLPSVAKAELSKHLDNPQNLAAAVADMVYTKKSAGSSANYVFDKLPALYQQLTGTALPETPTVAPTIAPSAIGAAGENFLQGETPEQAAANYARMQEQATLATPLPDVSGIPAGQASFLTSVKGQIKASQPPLSRAETARQTAARAFAAAQQLARQQAANAALGSNIPEVQNAVQESGSEGLDVQQSAQARQAVAERNTQGDRATQESQTGQEGVVNGPSIDMAAQGSQGQRNNSATGAGVGGIGSSVRGGVVSGARASAAGVGEPVAVGSPAGQRAAGVKLKNESKGELKNNIKLYNDLVATQTATPKQRIAYLTPIAELEITKDTNVKAQTRALAKQYLDSVPEKSEAMQARADAEKIVRLTSVDHERIQAERDKAQMARDKAAAEAETIAVRKSTKWSDVLDHFDDSAADPELVKQIGYNPHTQQSLATMLGETFGPAMQAAIRAGRVIIARNQLDYAARIGSLAARTEFTQGSYGRRGDFKDKVFFVAGNIHQTAQGYDGLSVALHEIGEHAGMENLLGKQTYTNLLNTIKSAMALQNPQTQFEKDVAAAQSKLMERQQGKPHEVLAYMIQHAPETTGLQKLWAKVRAWLVQHGLTNKMLDAQTLRALAEGATAKWLAEPSQVSAPASNTPAVQHGSYWDTLAQSGIEDPATRAIFSNYGSVTDAAKGLLSKAQTTQLSNLKPDMFARVISWLDKYHLVKQFDHLLGGGLTLNAHADDIQKTMSTRLSQMFNEPHQQFTELLRTDPKRADMITTLMQATEFQVDPTKTWEQHAHLQRLKGAELARAKKAVGDVRVLWGRLTESEQKLYHDLAQMNEMVYTAELAVTTYNMATANAGSQQLAEFKTDPSEQFRKSTEIHGSIDAAQTYWRGVLDSYTKALENHIAEQRGLLPQKQAVSPERQAAVKSVLKGIPNDKIKESVRQALSAQDHGKLTDAQQKIVNHLNPLEAQLRTIRETNATLAQAPYFHLGRFGDYFVSFRVRTGVDEQADPVAMAHVQKVLGTQFSDVTIRPDATDPHVFARFENSGTADAFGNLAIQLQRDGWLMKEGAKDKNNQDLGAIKRGVRSEIIGGYHTTGPNWLSRVIESIQAEDYDDATKAQIVANVRSLYLDSLPDTASIKFKQRREGRPGWSGDMMRAYAFRMRTGTNRVGSLSAEPTRTQSFATMNDALSQLQENKTATLEQIAQATAVKHEFEQRNHDQMNTPHTSAVDALRAMNHAFFLGLSPSYVLLQMTQLGVLTLPELAKTHGFVKSAKALAKATPAALRVMKTVITEGYKARGVAGAADMIVTSDLLKRAGLSDSDVQHITDVMASGHIDIGNAAHELGRVAEGEAGSNVLKVASSFGYASETVTRIATALAVKQLYGRGGDDVVQHAISTIQESMFTYGNENAARMMGKRGVAGPMSPLMFSFMQYQAQLLTKLYREFYTAIGTKPGTTAADREASRKFLAGHLASMLVLAGTMGLPFATVIAAAMDNLCGLLGTSSGDCDTKTAMRNMTADIFGHDIEPLISRGVLPRLAGADISDRAGEADILPFSKFLADKRKMDDKVKDLAWSSWGAPSSMVENMYKGFQKLADGDVLGGMQAAMPIALRGPVKAYSMSENGYTDSAGNKLPMTPDAWSIMLQTFGLNPGEKADYQQAKFAQSQRAGVIGRESQQIRNQLASAIEQGDQSGMQSLMSKAQEFDSANPSHAILPRMGGVLAQRAKARELAQAQGTTLGVSPRDYQTQQFTHFYQAQ